jgi:hypothetical protein
MSAYTAKRYYPQYDDARKAKTAQQLLKVLQTYPVDDTLCSIAMNHHCLTGEQHHEDYKTVVMYLIENKLTFPVAETLLAYIDENDHAEIFNTLMQKVQQRSDWHSQAGLVQYYCAQKTTDDEVLEQLSKSTNEQVRIAVALNQNTALQTLVHLSQDKSPDVVETAFCNMNIELCAEALSDYYIMLEEYRDIDTKLSVARRQASEVQQLLSQERGKTIQLSDENGVLRKENQELKRRNETLSAYYQMQKDSIDALQREVVKLQGAAMVNIYQMTPTQQCNEIVMPFIDLVSTLRQNHANGEFLFFVENGPHNWGKEVQCIHVSETAVTPLWYLSYAFNDKTRCNYKYTLKDHMPNSTKCRLITENEAMKIFGEKYYRSPIYTPRR